MARPPIPYDGPIVTRTQAMALGLVLYFSGVPCKRGHLAQRTVKRRHCPVCVEAFYTSEDQLSKARERYRRGGKAAIMRSNTWARLNPDKHKAVVALWTKANKDRVCGYNHKRRARTGSGGDHTPEEVLSLYQRQKGICVECRSSLKPGYERDHIVPLHLNGHNRISNIQLLCRPCNRKKGHKHPISWAQENGRLL